MDRRQGLILITGGAGFIGSNLAYYYLSQGKRVRVFDNLSRCGADINLGWLESLGSGQLETVVGDVRDYDELRRAVADADVIFHLASQVAVTASVLDPRHDFEVNALGTLNLLEAARESGRLPIIVFSSSNKVYGNLDGVKVNLCGDSYTLYDLPFGVPEHWPLDFCSPYGCSKGSADQYVRDYARLYGLPTVVFRQSCIYGPHQFGNEDQGWLAHFVFSALLGLPITIFGDGYQARDTLHVADLVRAFDLAVSKIDVARGKVYNLGGGPENVISLRQLLALLEEMLDRRIEVAYGDWRPGDQRVYVSDIRKAMAELHWAPEIPVKQGVSMLIEWARRNVRSIDLASAGARILPT